MIMSNGTLAVGLCSTCNNSPTCYYHARRGPAIYCEMFDDYAAPVGGDGLRSVGGTTPADRGARGDQAQYAGLCVNCDHRHTCAHPKPTGGVWHCEDYE